jgi:citronellol/citronellal dehydrogenase
MQPYSTVETIMQPMPNMRFTSDLLNGQVALVTGGGTGMGRATAIEMARCGADVVVLGRRAEPIEDCANIIRGLGRKAVAISADIRLPDQIDSAMLRIKEEFGRLDILVNNAGGQFVTPARELNNKGFETVIRNNLIGSWQMTKAVADHFMLEHGGSIVFVTACVRSGLSGFVHTAAARGGVLAMMKTLAFEWAEFGIRLNCVAPGTIKTEGMDHYPIDPEQWLKLNRNVMGHMGDVGDISAAIIFLSSSLGKFVTGEEWYIDGGETLHLAHDARQMIDAVKFSRREPAVPRSSEAIYRLQHLSDPHALVDGTHGVEFGGFLGSTDDVDFDTCRFQFVEQTAVGFLSCTDHDGVGLDQLRHALDLDMQSLIVDPLVDDARHDPDVALGEAAAQDPAGRHSEIGARPRRLALQHGDLARTLPRSQWVALQSAGLGKAGVDVPFGLELRHIHPVRRRGFAGLRMTEIFRDVEPDAAGTDNGHPAAGVLFAGEQIGI